MKAARPLRIVLATVGSRGDVQPMLALAQTLAARGHVPVVAAPPDFESWVRSLGFDFAGVGGDMQAFTRANADVFTGHPLAGLRTIKRFFAQEIPLQARQLVAACRGADALAWAGLALAAPSVAEHLRLPALGVFYSTCVIPSDRHPPPNVSRHGMAPWINRLVWKLSRLSAAGIIGKPVNAARAALGMAPVVLHRHVWDHGQFALAVDETLFPRDPAWDARRFAAANFIFFDDPAPLDPALAAWLDAGEPPVFIGFGSMSGRGTERVEGMIANAVGASGRRCVVGAGWAGLGDRSPLPPGWRVVRDVPHALLFPRMAAIVHHGGSGTMAQALRAGVPQVVLPLILDQYHHAHRLHLAGLVPRPIPMEKITEQGLTEAIAAALALPPGPRLAVAQRLQATDGRAAIAHRIEALCA